MKKFIVIISCLGLMGIVVSAQAGGTELVVDQGVQSFDQGTFEGTVLSHDGLILSGPGLKEHMVSEIDGKPIDGFTAVARGGGDVYVGTTASGQVLRLRKGKFVSVFKGTHENDIGVTALAWHHGALWVGLSPSGRVIRIDAQGKSHVVYDGDATYIWSIRADGKKGVVISTGSPGGLVFADSKGKVRRSGTLQAEHVMDTLQIGKKRWAATSYPGRVLELSGGKVAKDGSIPVRRVLLDMGMKTEVRRLQPVEGGMYAAVNPRKSGTTAPAPSKSAGGSDSKKSKSVSTGSAFGSPVVATAPLTLPKGSSVWFVDSSGTNRPELAGLPPILSMERADGVAVLLSLADRGRAFLFNPKGASSLYIDTPQAAISDILLNPDGTGYVATTGGAALYELRPVTSKPRYYSKVRDSGGMASMGRVDMVGKGFSAWVRTGSTYEVQADTWSGFVKVPAGGGVPKVTPQRFYQYRLDLSGKEAHARAIRLAFRSPNLAPSVHRVVVVDRVMKSSSPSKKKTPSRSRSVRKGTKRLKSSTAKRYTGIKRIGYDVQDLNGDKLRAFVSVRRIGTQAWIPITGKDGTTRLYVDWISADFPDGRYEVRVGISDALGNPPGQEKRDHLISEPVLIDNHPPSVAEIKVRDKKVHFTVRDAGSSLRAVEVAVDNGIWREVAPRDGIVDGDKESFQVNLRDLDGAGAGMVRIRAFDAMGNWIVDGVELK